VYLVPEHFVGEVEVTFEQTNSPPLAKEGKAYIYNIPPSGKLSTSSPMVSGPVEVYYVDDRGRRKRVSHAELHGVASATGGDRNPTASFFIGSREKFEHDIVRQPE